MLRRITTVAESGREVPAFERSDIVKGFRTAILCTARRAAGRGVQPGVPNKGLLPPLTADQIQRVAGFLSSEWKQKRSERLQQQWKQLQTAMGGSEAFTQLYSLRGTLRKSDFSRAEKATLKKGDVAYSFRIEVWMDPAQGKARAAAGNATAKRNARRFHTCQMDREKHTAVLKLLFPFALNPLLQKQLAQYDRAHCLLNLPVENPRQLPSLLPLPSVGGLDPNDMTAQAARSRCRREQIAAARRARDTVKKRLHNFK